MTINIKPGQILRNIEQAIRRLLDFIFGWLGNLIGYALILAFFVKMAALLGKPVPYVPAIDHTVLLYMAGGWYLCRK